MAVFCAQAYADYDDMINLTEELICELAMDVCGTLDISYQVRARPRRGPNGTLHAAVRLAAHGAARAQGVDISLQRPWRRAPMHGAPPPLPLPSVLTGHVSSLLPY